MHYQTTTEGIPARMSLKIFIDRSMLTGN